MEEMEVIKHFNIIVKLSPSERARYLQELKQRKYGSTFGGKKTLEDLMAIRVLFAIGGIRLDEGKRCCQCGACCDRVLKLSNEEQLNILACMKKHPEIRERIEEINKGKPHRKCPFLDHTRENKKCMIYDFECYPANCRIYMCDGHKPNPYLVANMYKSIPKYVDLWHLIGDPVDIAQAWEFKDILDSKGQYLVPEIYLHPEKLVEKLLK